MCSVKRFVRQQVDAFSLSPFSISIPLNASNFFIGEHLNQSAGSLASAEENNRHPQFHLPFEIQVNQWWQVTLSML